MKASFFPGQGSQAVGMGRAFYDEFTVFRQVIEEASDSLGFNLKSLLFEGPEAELILTENAQPAILAVSVGCYRVAERELNYTSQLNLGHSLGEYSALVCAEAFPFSEAVKWVKARGLAMQKAVPVGTGTMSAVIGANDEDVEQWCKEATAIAKTKDASETVEPANFNAPGQVVVSGSVMAVECFETMIAEKNLRGVMVKRLTVSAPFHCSLMKPARDEMEKIFAMAAKSGLLSPLETPYVPNRTAKICKDSENVFRSLAEQVDHSVLWKQSVDHVIENHYTVAVEFGPGKVLQGLAKRIAKAKGATFETYPVYDLESLKVAQGAIK